MAKVLPARPALYGQKIKKAAPPSPSVPISIQPVPAATGGVSSARSIGSAAPGFAQVIENGFPTQTGVRPRGGLRRQATTGTRAVKSLMTYKSGPFQSMFAVANGSIYDVTDPADPLVAPTASASGKTSSDYVSVNFSTAGGTFMICVNGADLHLTYDGTNFAVNTPAITVGTSSTFSFVWAYASRLWFIQKDTLTVWYLPVDSIGGAATALSLKGIFPKGGSLKFGGTWSSDTGSGLNEKIVFVSTTGECAVFTGTDPSSSTTWSRVGVYDVSMPLGRKASRNIGGDLLITTVNGIVPLSLAVTKSASDLSISAVTKEINPAWKAIAAIYRAQEWSLTEWPEKNLMMVAFAGAYTLTGGTTDVIDSTPTAYIVNLETGAWNSSYTGWDVQCSTYFNGKMYFGSANGRVYEAEKTGSDDGVAYVFRYLEWPDGMGNEATKEFLQARSTFTYSQPFNAQVTISVNHNVTWPPAPAAAGNSTTGGYWDLGDDWDLGGTWDSTPNRITQSLWRSLGRTGYRGAIQIQMTINNTAAPDVEIVSNDVAYRQGAVVT